MRRLHKLTKGFTIIEVVLVLAIAALIFLMVFVALPALQASQRDTARKNDASSVAAAAQNYMSSERKALTADAESDFQNKYVNELDQYEKDNVTVKSFSTDEGTPESDEVQIVVGAKCDGTVVKRGVSRSAAVFVQLESGGNEDNRAYHCVDI